MDQAGFEPAPLAIWLSMLTFFLSWEIKIEVILSSGIQKGGKERTTKILFNEKEKYKSLEKFEL